MDQEKEAKKPAEIGGAELLAAFRKWAIQAIQNVHAGKANARDLRILTSEAVYYRQIAVALAETAEYLTREVDIEEARLQREKDLFEAEVNALHAEHLQEEALRSDVSRAGRKTIPSAPPEAEEETPATEAPQAQGADQDARS